MGQQWLPVLLTACNLGHHQFRKGTVPAPSGGTCKTDVFKKDGSIRDHYIDHALISDICGMMQTTADPIQLSMDTSSLLSFAIVEFNDSGTYWDRTQFTNLKQEIARIADFQTSSDTPGPGILLMMFVHGWRQNASEGSSNLHHFRQFAQHLSSSPSICNVKATKGSGCPAKAKPHVLAVYLGWRGDSTGATSHLARQLGPFRALAQALQLPTFWHRKSAARRAAGIAMTETILGTLAELQNSDRTRRAKRPIRRRTDEASLTFHRSKKILIGHSFGARALELAVAQAYLGDRARSLQLYEDEIGKDGRLTRSLEDVERRLENLSMELEATDAQLQEAQRRSAADEHQLDVIGERLERLQSKQGERQRDLEEVLTTLEAHRELGSVTIDSFRGPCLSYDRVAVEQCATRGQERQQRSSAGDSWPLSRVICGVRMVQCLEELAFLPSRVGVRSGFWLMRSLQICQMWRGSHAIPR